PSVFTVSVLASPGTPSSSTCPPVINPIRSRSIICRCPTMTCAACWISASTNADSCWMRSLRRRMSVAGWALKVPFLCGCRRLPEPPEPTKLPAHFGSRSFRVPERVAGPVREGGEIRASARVPLVAGIFEQLLPAQRILRPAEAAHEQRAEIAAGPGLSLLAHLFQLGNRGPRIRRLPFAHREREGVV